ncbi:MAG: trimethylamine methyltransferase family protein [Mariniphaga sp.]|nr:trimethylamine methyltransferase family protein [Mariniphaga sp.]
MSIFKSNECVRPKLQLLGSEQMNEIHQYSIRILEDTGIEVESKEALKIFKKSDAVKIKNGVVYIKAELVNHAIKKAPSNIEVFNKTGDIAFQLGKGQGNNTYFGIGVTNTWYQDIETNQVELFTRKHMQHSTKLGDLLDNYDMISTLGIPSDVDAGESDLFSALDMYANTSKPMVLLISGENKINEVLELLSFLHGDISEKPFCIPYVNPITPLVLNKTTTDKMIASIEHRLPVMYSNYSLYGGTSPVTEGGSLALLNAELLAGLVFSQLVKEGSKIILGSLPAAFNMTTMGSQYTPTSYLLNLACAEMMNYYKIPHCGTSGSNNGRGADLLASGDLWLNHLSSCIGKIGCAPFVGGNFDSMAFSPTTVVLSNHIIGEARKFAKGFILNEKAVNLPEISTIGHGGNYFTSEQTLALLNELDSSKTIWPSMSLDTWKEKEMPTAEKDLINYTLDLYSKAKKASEETIDIIKKGEEFINNRL